ncbi:Citrate transporter [Haladaptatus paucihalophilus DX253]|uniref:Citrate transporter n=1 Tax=Haladaptatus paucihalophilus DX253 TaxID=797209 RepID=E7QPN0_HALPU|nr:SLC13 family permease [Haladaptatus paucihalophilus]EFW93446.1 Citrate transporter [Haladaptatus paucihalophilus DX253]SHL19466.1 Di-and tricarboxylate transporter [Haladaptatus paucihalophilus DX253]
MMQTGLAAVTTDMLVVFAIVLIALVFFATELLPVDVTAILIMVTLMVLEPWTGISTTEGIAGFANEATITVLAMLILSAGVSQTGVVQLLGSRLADFAGSDLRKQLFATIGVAGPASGFVNNTPVVAILVPVITDLAHEGKTSPSKLLIPLSYASMLGGMLTLIGTSTNILASNVTGRLAERTGNARLHAFSMFEFTGLGVIVLVVGGLYLLFVGHRLLPERVPPEEDYIEEYEMENYLTEVEVAEGSPFVDQTVEDAIDEAVFDAEIIQLVRDDETFIEHIGQRTIRAGDVLTLRIDKQTLSTLTTLEHLTLAGTPTEAEIDPGEEQTLVEVVIPSGSSLVGETLSSSTFRERFDAAVLAFRSRGEVIHERLDRVTIRVGDTLLVQASADSIDRLAANRDFIVAHQVSDPDYRTEKIPAALAIIVGVVSLAALGVFPILVTALGGVVAMVATGVLKPGELYESVEWNVIFLLAGVIPLGVALENSGGAELLGGLVAASANYLPVVAVLWIFYIATGLITEVISNNASVVLMIPVAVEAATRIDANPFAFVLAVTFAASTSFLGPVGYQTNLFVYGPGGYKFTDYFRIGAPLQLLLSAVTVAGIVTFWGL